MRPHQKILIVDDLPENLRSLRRVLNTLDVEVVVAASGEAAMAAVAEHQFALAILDVLMPEMDGYQLAGLLRADARTMRLPIIFVTAVHGEAESVFRGYEAGAVDFIFKPFSHRVLLSKVRVFLELDRKSAALAETVDALRESDRRKDEFLATLAHELRNPLAPISNAVEILKVTGLANPLQEQARVLIERQLQHLVHLIDDLLDVNRITRGKLELRREHVDLRALLEQVVEVTRPALERAGQTFSVELPSEPILLDADPVRLTQVFVNLLDNAGKYTEPGGQIQLLVEQGAGEVIVEVRDDGIGIEPEHVPRLFDLFMQFGKGGDRAKGGLGLGLALSRGLVEMHGGRIVAESAGPGRGSQFSVHLPALDIPEPLASPVASLSQAEIGQATRPSSILVVEDNRDAADSVVLLLELKGFRVMLARDGLEAVETAAAERPEVVLMDLGMPRLDGLDACRRIREQPWGQEMRIIALTGRGQDLDRHQSRAAGFDGHLVKPVKWPDLLWWLTDRCEGEVSLQGRLSTCMSESK